jgi:hypothetical protein
LPFVEKTTIITAKIISLTKEDISDSEDGLEVRLYKKAYNDDSSILVAVGKKDYSQL